MLYEALTGRLPFSGKSDMVLERKLYEDPPLPQDLVGDLPDDLCALCEALLDRDPAARPDRDKILASLGVVV